MVVPPGMSPPCASSLLTAGAVAAAEATLALVAAVEATLALAAAAEATLAVRRQRRCCHSTGNRVLAACGAQVGGIE